MPNDISGFKKLLVWQKSLVLATHVYSLTRTFPIEERFGLSSQMQRAAVSICSNIAEGSGRGSKREFAQFISIALGSACEVEAQAAIAHGSQLIDTQTLDALTHDIVEVKMMLAALRRKLLG